MLPVTTREKLSATSELRNETTATASAKKNVQEAAARTTKRQFALHLNENQENQAG